MKIDGASFGTPLNHVLTGGEVTAGKYDFTVAGSALGTDGVKSLTTVVTDVAGNVGTVSTALSFSLDKATPTLEATTFNSVPGAKTITLDLTENVSMVGNPAALKAAITVSTDDGTSFSALSVDDTVAITNDKLVVTFNSFPVSDTVKVKVAAATLQDGAGNQAQAITTAAIDTQLDVTQYNTLSAAAHVVVVAEGEVVKAFDAAGDQNFLVMEDGVLFLTGSQGENTVVFSVDDTDGYQLDDLSVSHSGTTVFFWSDGQKVASIGTSGSADDPYSQWVEIGGNDYELVNNGTSITLDGEAVTLTGVSLDDLFQIQP